MADERDYCTFFVAGQLFGLDVQNVQEVIRPQRLTRVPLASPVVSGLMNLRGQIVTALDLRRRLSFPDRAADAGSMNVVVRTADGAVSLVVDDVGDVIRASDSTLAPPPDTLRGVPRNLIRGVQQLSGRLLIILELTPITTLEPSGT